MPKDQNPPETTTPKGAPLGKSAKSPDAPKENPRKHRFSLQAQAARILPKERVKHCRWTISDMNTGVNIWKRNDKARFGGLQTCGSVWHCPVCSHIISEGRRQELNTALTNARQQTLMPVLITLTFQHQRGEDLPTLMKAVKKAKQHWHDSRTYKRYKAGITGTITATELTHGANGWHPHFHLLMFINEGMFSGLKGPVQLAQKLDTFKDDLRTAWTTSLAKFERFGNGASFDFQDATAAGSYVAKWGAGEEITMGHKKTGKGNHPFELLAQAKHDKAATALFFEYATTFKGTRQLVWSKGLKEALNVQTQDDEVLAEEAHTNEDEWLAAIHKAHWNDTRNHGRHTILTAAESGPEALTALLATKPPETPQEA